ncbi:hypothetical protein B7P43_G10507 [Cryptotermes secundus]|uniref:VWA N-terminal domain-containing protein n=1 Tax=Cryptotermes secundus TaxID=105785 RepID=A0A2J7PJ51_9NEOP|nr:hypothetical protein B7P43_G10507 [Cryptotermes secundus]
MGTPANLIIQGALAIALLLVTALQVGVADTDAFFSLRQRENIKFWADELGDELWYLGQSITKATDMKARYKKLHLRVQEKDGEAILKEIVDNVQRMLDRKMDAVRCIVIAAEDAAESFNRTNVPENYTFYSAKDSYIAGDTEQSENLDNSTYTPMELYTDSHFYNIPVNLNYSIVHVPTNIYYEDDPVYDTIKWSESLDDVFIQNYYSDPALSFQYFGSSLGIMRSYPGSGTFKQQPALRTL